MGKCQDGHSLSVAGRMVVRWCPECARVELRVWAAEDGAERVVTLIPEWAEVVRLEDDEWAARTITKYATGLVHIVRQFEDDERRGVARLL